MKTNETREILEALAVNSAPYEFLLEQYALYDNDTQDDYFTSLGEDCNDEAELVLKINDIKINRINNKGTPEIITRPCLKEDPCIEVKVYLESVEKPKKFILSNSFESLINLIIKRTNSRYIDFSKGIIWELFSDISENIKEVITRYDTQYAMFYEYEEENITIYLIKRINGEWYRNKWLFRDLRITSFFNRFINVILEACLGLEAGNH